MPSEETVQQMRDTWRRLPIAYHGRCSTIVVSGIDVRRPHGQITPGVLAATAQLDLECELGDVCGPGAIGPIAIDRAEQHIFGVVLVNDWSARDIQRYEASRSARSSASPSRPRCRRG